jgi:hypothetical protein
MESRLPKRTRPHVTRGPDRARPLTRRAHRGEPVAVAPPAGEPAPTRRLLRFTRHGIPALTVTAGVVAMAFGSETSLIGGAGLIGAGLASWLIAWLYRLGVAGDRARDAEERARRQFDRTGRWPDA